MKKLTVEAVNVSGFLGRPSNKITGNMLSVTNGKHYEVTEDGKITDDSGREIKLNPKPYAKTNGVDFYYQDNSISEGHSDFKIVS